MFPFFSLNRKTSATSSTSTDYTQISCNGNHKLTLSDCANVSQLYVSACSARIASIIAGLCRKWVKTPSGNDSVHAIGGMPAVVGCTDCTHVVISKLNGV